MNEDSRSSKRLQILKERHKYLNREVDRMSAMKSLSPKEKILLREMKVMRLRCKDGIESISLEIDAFEIE